MLQPKKVRHRKQQRGRMRGQAKGGTTVTFGDYGLMALEPGWITNRQIEAARIAMTRHIRRGGKHNPAAQVELNDLRQRLERRNVMCADPAAPDQSNPDGLVLACAHSRRLLLFGTIPPTC